MSQAWAGRSWPGSDNLTAQEGARVPFPSFSVRSAVSPAESCVGFGKLKLLQFKVREVEII